jgi:uncharacterized protein
VIVRYKFAHRVLAAGLSPAELVQGYERLVEIVEPDSVLHPVCRDPDDDHVLACAIAADADLIDSRDERSPTHRRHRWQPAFRCQQT